MVASANSSSVLIPSQPRANGADIQPQALSTAITTSSPQADGGPSPSGAGPTGRSYVIPPRPKPGRKPATDEPQSKRKAQNRESQRAFRARKLQKVVELQNQVDATSKQHREERNALIAEQDKLQQRIAMLEQQNKAIANECEYWKQQYDRLKDGATAAAMPTPTFPGHSATMTPTSTWYMQPDTREDEARRNSVSSYTGLGTPNTSTGCGRCRPDSCACMEEVLASNDAHDPPFMEAVPLPRKNEPTPMQGVEMSTPTAHDPLELETDFTTKFQRRVTEDFHQSCGFCTDESNCLCIDQSLQSNNETLSQVTAAPPAPVLSGPGSCDKCQRDPAQKAWCQSVARLREEEKIPLSRRNSGAGPALETMEPKIDTRIDNISQKSSPIPGCRSIGCSETYKLFDGRVPMDPDGKNWRTLRPIQKFTSMEPGTYSAMEVDVGSILTTLQHSGAPLKPRPSDGANAILITKAAELRRRTESPHVNGSAETNRLGPVSSFNLGH